MGTIGKNDIAALKKKGEWFTVKVMEEYRYWKSENPWNPEFFRKNNFTVVAFSARTSRPTNETNRTSYSRKHPLRLPCGISVDRGYYGTTAQSRVASLANVRVDGVGELNQVLRDASTLFDLDMWEITRLVVHNRKLGPIVTFALFNPDGTGTGLYLETVENQDSKRTYFDVPAYEQQSLCNNIQEKIANCVLVQRTVPSCGLMEYYKAHGKDAVVPQKTNPKEARP